GGGLGDAVGARAAVHRQRHQARGRGAAQVHVHAVVAAASVDGHGGLVGEVDGEVGDRDVELFLRRGGRGGRRGGEGCGGGRGLGAAALLQRRGGTLGFLGPALRLLREQLGLALGLLREALRLAARGRVARVNGGGRRGSGGGRRGRRGGMRPGELPRRVLYRHRLRRRRLGHRRRLTRHDVEEPRRRGLRDAAGQWAGGQLDDVAGVGTGERQRRGGRS